jgi:hypothetical protein
MFSDGCARSGHDFGREEEDRDAWADRGRRNRRREPATIDGTDAVRDVSDSHSMKSALGGRRTAARRTCRNSPESGMRYLMPV